MSVIREFKCIRPAQDKAAEIAALPYDVYNSSEAREIVKKNPKSFLAIDRAETAFEEGHDIYAGDVYEKARDILDEWIKNGDFIEDQTYAFYIYELTMQGRVQTGLVALSSIDDYENSVIKKHENTRADKEEDRIRHVDTCSAQTGPIFLAYKAHDGVKSITDRIKKGDALYDFVSDDGIRHRVFEIADSKDIENLKRYFEEIGDVYIADGHHRAASAVKVGLKRRKENPGFTGDEEFNYFLSVSFPDDELYIMDYNRIIKDLNGMDEDAFFEKVSDLFEVSDIEGDTEDDKKPHKKGYFSMYLKDKWYSLKVREKDIPDDPVASLDVSLLQDILLEPVLGISDPKTDKRIDFVGGIRGIEELEKRCREGAKCAFAMYPTSIGELFSVADAGLLMPPKSTWFEPKLRSGLFIHRI